MRKRKSYLKRLYTCRRNHLKYFNLDRFTAGWFLYASCSGNEVDGYIKYWMKTYKITLSEVC